MLKFPSFVMRSVGWSQLRRIDQELQRIMDNVTVNTQPSRDEHLLKCLIKSQMADHPQQWDDHCADIRYFIGSFKYFQGDFETLFKVSQGHDRYFIVLSESEYLSWQNFGWIRSPRTSDELASPQDQVHHAIHMFNRIGDAINHLYYLRVAHSFMFICHTDSAHGRYYIYSGTLRGKVEDIPSVSEEARARTLRIVIDKDSMSYTDEVKYKKVKLRQFFKFHQIWSAETEMFSLSQTASSFMTSHVLYHKLVSVRNHLGDQCRIIKSDSLSEFSNSFEAVILTWSHFCSPRVNCAQTSPRSMSTAASQPSICESNHGKSSQIQHQQWKSMNQTSSAARRAQAQVPAQQFS